MTPVHVDRVLSCITILGEDIESQCEAEFRKDDGSYLEIWNLVFMQFNRDTQGNLTPLPRPSVDTGMGLERIVSIKQGATANYDIDLFKELIKLTEEITSRPYKGKNYTEERVGISEQQAVDTAMRVIADHARSAAFLIADGIIPSSDGRGYVLRRLIRRAARHSKVLGIKRSFIYEIVERVVEIMGTHYDELNKSRSKIVDTVRREEERFSKTLDTGLQFLNKEIKSLISSSGKTLSGTVAFTLHDTYGFPLDLTMDIVSQEGISVDETEFAVEMDKQKERSRASRSSEAGLVLRRSVKPFESEFVGYQNSVYESVVVGLYHEKGVN